MTICVTPQGPSANDRKDARNRNCVAQASGGGPLRVRAAPACRLDCLTDSAG